MINRMERFANRPVAPTNTKTARACSTGRAGQTDRRAGGGLCPNGDLSPWERGRPARIGFLSERPRT